MTIEPAATRLRHQGPLVVWLVLVWMLLWGTWSWANLLSGLLVALAVLTLLPLPHVAGGVVTSLLTLLAVARVWTRAFWRSPNQSPAEETAAAAAAASVQRHRPASADGVRSPDGTASPDGPARTALQDAWRRHTAVATAAEPGLPPAAGAVRALRPLPRTMVGATAALVALTVALTGLAGPLYGLADRAATDLLERTPYILAVFGAEEVP